MSFIERFFYCVLYSECPLSEVLLYTAVGWSGLWHEDADRTGCGGGDQIPPWTRSSPPRHQTQERSGESLSLSQLNSIKTPVVCTTV